MGSAGTSIAPDATPGGATMAWRSFSRKRGATRRRQCPYTRDERWRPTVPLRTHRSQAGDQEGRTHSRPSFLVVRHFWTCADRVCQFFEWDEAETQKLQSEREAEVQFPAACHRAAADAASDESGRAPTELADPERPVRDCIEPVAAGGDDEHAAGRGPDVSEPCSSATAGPKPNETAFLASTSLRKRWRGLQ